MSQGEIEISLISKNFFFTFFNLFVVFTIFGTFSNAYVYLKDTTKVAYVLAESLERLGPFYMNFIVLQGLGLFPLRLLEFGSVSLYPINLMGAKTPRGTCPPFPVISQEHHHLLLYRLCRTRTAPDFQLWLLLTSDYTYLYYLHSVQCSAKVRAC